VQWQRVATAHTFRLVRVPLLTLVVCVLALGGCAATTYTPFETRGDGIFDGKGGVAVRR